jgi:DNA-binding response OmpR family regulator
MPKNILIIEDEAKIVEICRDYLQAAGFAVTSASDGPSGLAAARELSPDLVVLDLMLPGMDGLEICRQIRKTPGPAARGQGRSVPIIILTARHKESDKLLGLETGADDYITKPFSPRELIARVRTVLRRVDEEDAALAASAGPPPALLLDHNRYKAILPGRAEISLTPTEFDILSTLASDPGQIFSRSELLHLSQGVSFRSYERAVDSHIRNLRKKIDPPGTGREHIVTVHGFGYKYIP